MLVNKTKRMYHKGKALEVPKEEVEQIKLADYCKIKRLPHTHIANERMASVNFKKKLKAMGVSSGFPDMLIFLPSKILFVELKREKKSLTKVSDYQEEWIETINLYDYAKAEVCYGAGAAIDLIEKELRG